MNSKFNLIALLMTMFMASVTLNATSQVYPNSGDQAVCQFSTEPYGVDYSTTSTYAWTIIPVTGGNGTITVGATPNLITVDWETIGTCTLQLVETNDAGCSVTVSITITVNPTPTPVIAGADVVCAGDTEAYDVTFTDGNTYLWSVTGGTIETGQGTNQVAVNWTGPSAGSLTVTETAGSCYAEVSKDVIINALPATLTIFHN